MPDIGASILAKLKNKAKEGGMSYQQCLQLFFQEEFLRRLSMSRYTDNLILKGGLFIYTLTEYESRATVDIDFLLRRLDSSIEHIEMVVNDILNTQTGNNDVVILAAGRAEQISQQRKYHGASTQIIGRINHVRVPFDVDIGVGDVIIPKPLKRTLPIQLEGFDPPQILTYSLESTIAEKFDAILQRFELSGRMKDFYDIYYLSHTFDFDGRSLQEAFIQTLSNRGTHYDRDSFDRVIALSEDTGMKTKWRYFLKSIRGAEIEFSEITKGINAFLRPVWSAIIDEDDFFLSWECTGGLWF